MTSPANAIKARLRADLKAAMQAKHVVEIQAIRNLLAAIDNAEAVPLSGIPQTGPNEIPRLALSDDDVEALLATEIANRQTAADEIARLGRDDRAAILREEAAIVARYLRG